MKPTQPNPAWVETQATVTTCKYQFARLNTFTLGIQTNDKFRITFDYYAHGRVYSGEFQSPIAIPQNDTFPITYNPLAPQQNSKSASIPTSKTPLFALAIAGSILLSLLYLALLRSCN